VIFYHIYIYLSNLRKIKDHRSLHRFIDKAIKQVYNRENRIDTEFADLLTYGGILMAQQLHMQRPDLENLDIINVSDGYKIRTYREGDEKAWAEIINNSLGSGWDAERCRRELTGRLRFRPEGLFFSAYQEEPVGTACAWTQSLDEKKVGYVHMVGVIPEHRGKKLGYALCLSVLHFFRENNFQRAQLHTDDFRLPAIKTYLNLGFKPDYIDENHKARWDAVFNNLNIKR
jgi:mycothiol synthase